jgi:thiamine biosynthesis protein ThiS
VERTKRLKNEVYMKLHLRIAITIATTLLGARRVNGAIVPRAAWPQTKLQPGDNVEIVRARQGG